MLWCDLAFLHWPVPADVLRPLVPPGLDIDTFDGHAWLGVVPFRMEGVRLRGAPRVPTTHAFPEINVRTYVRAGDRNGVWFFSLDASSRLAVRGARYLYNLPYFDAQITVTTTGGDAHAGVSYVSRRVHRHARPAEFVAQYAPVGEIYEPTPGTRDHFLVERYCLFMHDERRGLGRLDVDHRPWPLQQGRAAITTNTMADAAGIALPQIEPLVHFARALDVVAWTRVDAG
jgi:hypothetical protein